MLGAEAFYYVIIDTPNDMISDLKWSAKSLMVGRKNNQTKKIKCGKVRLAKLTNNLDACANMFHDQISISILY